MTISHTIYVSKEKTKLKLLMKQILVIYSSPTVVKTISSRVDNVLEDSIELKLCQDIFDRLSFIINIIKFDLKF